MFKPTAGEKLVELLIEWGVDHIYGMPGTITFAQAAGYTKHTLKALFEEGKLDLPPL